MADEKTENPFKNKVGSDSKSDAAEKAKEKQDGVSGQNPEPAFADRVEQDQNMPVTTEEELEHIEEGAESQSPSAETQERIQAYGAKAKVGKEAPDSGDQQYVVSGIARLKIGKYEFQNGVLNVPQDEVEDFEKLVKGISVQTRSKISKVSRGEGGVPQVERLSSTMNRGVDTTASSERTSPKPQ